MPAIPLPFVVAGALLLTLLRLVHRRNRDLWFLIFIGACAVQATLVGLRWSLGIGVVHLVQPVLASCLPLLALAAFTSLRQGRLSRWHFVWPVAVILSLLFLPVAVDPLLVVEFIAYGLTILRLHLPPEVLTQVRIGDEWTISAARIGVALLLILSAISDMIVSLALSGGDRALAGPALGAMMGVVLVGLAGGLLGWSSAATPEEDLTPLAAPQMPAAPREETVQGSDEDQTILATVEAALAHGLYRDPDLTLERLARRTRIPARKISRAVNALRACSVTDLVNGYRVREAMRLLRDSDHPVTQIMFDAGFQTKSNFNRAFKAIAGQTPSAYRATET